MVEKEFVLIQDVYVWCVVGYVFYWFDSSLFVNWFLVFGLKKDEVSQVWVGM